MTATALSMNCRKRWTREKLAKAVDELFEKYPAGVASVYLQMFQLQTEDGWEELAEVLANDPRVTIR